MRPEVEFIFWHTSNLALHSARDGEHYGIIYLLAVGFTNPKLRVSQFVCLGGLLDFLIKIHLRNSDGL